MKKSRYDFRPALFVPEFGARLETLCSSAAWKWMLGIELRGSTLQMTDVFTKAQITEEGTQCIKPRPRNALLISSFLCDGLRHRGRRCEAASPRGSVPDAGRLRFAPGRRFDGSPAGAGRMGCSEQLSRVRSPLFH